MDTKRKFMIVFTTSLVLQLVPTGSTGSSQMVQGGVYPFFMIADQMIDPTEAFHTLPNTNICNCKFTCFALGQRCNAWSVTQLPDESSECRLAERGPIQTRPVNDTSSKYFFKQSAIEGDYKWGGDGLLYVELSQKYTLDDGKRQCASIPGHRLIMVKTLKTFRFFITHISDGSVFYASDLRKVNQESFIWGDGTLYKDTELTSDHITVNNDFDEDMFMLYQNKLNDCTTKRCGPFKIICQTNPLGVDW